MTIKQKLVAKKILENPSIPVGRAMREVGYSENSAIAPGKNLTGTKGWKELMEEYLPDDKLLKTHQEALTATKWNDFTGDREEDHQVRLKAVDLGYKLKGKTGATTMNQFNAGDMTLQFIGGKPDAGGTT